MRPLLSAACALSLVAPIKSALGARAVVVALPQVECAPRAPQPGGLCQPYDRAHCQFADGTLMRDDPRDPNAPYLLSPVPSRAGLYCRYDAESRPAGVALVPHPAEQKRRQDESKHRHHR